MPRLSDAEQFVSIKAIYMAAGATYTAGLWSTDPGNMASISAIAQTSGATFRVTTGKAHGLTTGLPTAITGVVSSGGSGAGTLETLMNASTFSGGVTPGSLNPTVIDSFNFTVTLASTPSDPSGYTSGGVVGAGGELTGGAGPYARQSVVFQGNDPQINNNAQVNWTGLPVVTALGAGIPTLYVVIFNTGSYAGSGEGSLVDVSLAAGATIEAPVGDIVGQVL